MFLPKINFHLVSDNVSVSHYHHSNSVTGDIIVEVVVKQKTQCAVECLLQSNCNGFRAVPEDNLHRCQLLELSTDGSETFLDLYVE